jgi:hypothetical protein
LDEDREEGIMKLVVLLILHEFPKGGSGFETHFSNPDSPGEKKIDPYHEVGWQRASHHYKEASLDRFLCTLRAVIGQVSFY